VSDEPAARWADALQAAALFAVDPAGCGGVLLRAGAGPVRDAWLAQMRRWLGERPLRRLPLHIGDERLLGGLDLTATLQAGRPVAQRGLLADADGGVLIAAMAERLSPATAARLAAVLDHGEVRIERDGLAQRHAARFGIVALDEGQGDDEPVPGALRERLGFVLELDAVAPREAEALPGPLDAQTQDERVIDEARRRLGAVRAGDDVLQALTGAAAALGIASLRPPLLALRVACAAAALEDCEAVQPEHAALAVRLVLAPRATRWPVAADEEDEADEPPEDTPPESPPEPPPDVPPEPPPPEADTEPPAAPDAETLADVLLQAAQAALPAGLLARLKSEQARRERARGAGKAGARHKSGARGRPAGVRRGPPRAGARLSLIDTLRAAAPWQRLRVPAPGARIRVFAEDFHVTRLRQRRETTTVFVVDASGSAALHRLAEAKGAVELLLADCYVRRDRVAVLAFRGRTAELLLPPTRSLVRAKRSLAGLPGGGGTPLAAALDATAALVDAVRRRGETPLVVLLTDGRANVARDGSGGRARAEEDALASARLLGAGGTAVLLVDTSPQPQPQARRLAEALQATYLPLPHGAAQDLSRVVRAGSPR
jgi:magnesium chelatase subunit D